MEAAGDDVRGPSSASEQRSAVMLSMEQVAALMQRVKDEQAVLLAQQRDAIVQQVMQSLRASGVAVVPDTQDGRERRRRTRGALSPTQRRLEQNLHALVLHSLDESGLDFPHVQRPEYAGASSSRGDHKMNGSDDSAPRGAVASQRQPIIVARREGAASASLRSARVCRSDAVDPPPVADSAVWDEAGALSQRSSRQLQQATVKRTSKRSEPRAAIARSPLGRAQRTCKGESRRQSRSKTSQQQPRRATDAREQDDSDSDSTSAYAQAAGPIDAAFDSVRDRVGQKTLAILAKSQALLSETKDVKRSSGNGRNSFVARMREMHALDANKATARARALSGERSSDAEQPLVVERADEAAKSDGVTGASTAADDDVEGAASPDKTRARRTSQTRSEQAPSPTGGLATAPTMPRCDIDLLRPPERLPVNEDEWENELARQILTIYATSVKAKAAGVDSGIQSSSSSSLEPRQTASSRLRPASRGRGAVMTDSGSGGAAPNAPTLASSCSLPVLNTRSKLPSAVAHSRATASVHYSWEPSQRLDDGRVVINMPRVPRPIWFAGTGAVKAVWCALAQGFADGESHEHQALAAMCEHRLCEQVRRMEAKRQFSECIATLESLLIALVRARGVEALDAKLWKQLVVTCNAFASRSIDYQAFPRALQLIKQAEQLIHNSVLVTDAMRLELLAYLYDTYAHYYYRKRKPHAGLHYILKAHEIHTRQRQFAHLAKCRLHIATLLSLQRKHEDAMAYMASILDLIERNQLEDSEQQHSSSGDGASAQKICLAAVCYNNLAVEQLHLRAFEAASVSAANAKRLARLCLSYSNRWLAHFEATSNCAALAIATLMEDANVDTALVPKPALDSTSRDRPRLRAGVASGCGGSSASDANARESQSSSAPPSSWD